MFLLLLVAEASVVGKQSRRRGVTENSQSAVCQITTKGAKQKPCLGVPVETGAMSLSTQACRAWSFVR